MSQFVKDFWQRACRALATARSIATADPDAAASRAYYAAFYAVSALFALESRQFVKHAAIEAAVHRNLVKTGRWPAELGADYHSLRKLRDTGDYGQWKHVDAEEALEAIGKAERILRAVQDSCPDLSDLTEKP